MSNIKVKWYGDRVQKKFEYVLKGRMEDAMRNMVDHVKEKISRGNKRGGNPSAPGEPPKVVTGRLRSSISWNVRTNPIVGVFGSNVVYARYLEKGTAVMEKRPFLIPSLFERSRQIVETLAG